MTAPVFLVDPADLDTDPVLVTGAEGRHAATVRRIGVGETVHLVDGAGNRAKFRHVTIPMLSPALFYNLVTSTIAALQIFELAAFIQTPESVGTFVNWLIYQEAFTLRNMGMASAMAWILLLIILALTALIFRSSEFWVFYQGQREKA